MQFSHVLVFASGMISDHPFMTSTQTGGGREGSSKSGRMWTGGGVKAMIMTSTIKKNQHCISFLFLARNGCFMPGISKIYSTNTCNGMPTVSSVVFSRHYNVH